MARVLKITVTEFQNDSRDSRELSVLVRLGHEVIVMAKGDVNKIRQNPSGLLIHWLKVRNSKASGIKKAIQRIGSLAAWAKHARKLKPDCISGHDLIALFIGWMSTWFLPRNERPVLVYDAHEFEIGRNTGGKRSALVTMMIRFSEKFLMHRCALSIMVSDSIADAVQTAYGLDARPLVVRNIPPLWEISQEICNRQRQTFCMQLGVTKDCTLLMYWGGIARGRGLEKLLQVISNLNNCSLVIMGYGESNYLEQLEQTASDLKVANRVLFHPAVPGDMIWQYAGAVDIAMITIPNISKSYYYMLPNKLFESIQSLTPVIASDFPEVRRVVKEYDIGLLVNPDSAQEITSAIETLRMDKLMYLRMKENLLKAKKILCWEKERTVLEHAYNQIL